MRVCDDRERKERADKERQEVERQRERERQKLREIEQAKELVRIITATLLVQCEPMLLMTPLHYTIFNWL